MFVAISENSGEITTTWNVPSHLLHNTRQDFSVFRQQIQIVHNRQTYKVPDGLSFVLTLCSHRKRFLRHQFVHHRKHGLSRHDQSRPDSIIHCTSSCGVRYLCLNLAKTGINRRTWVKPLNMKIHANSRYGSGTVPCRQTKLTVTSRCCSTNASNKCQLGWQVFGPVFQIGTVEYKNNCSPTTFNEE
jgi:hypothetical protein